MINDFYCNKSVKICQLLNSHYYYECAIHIWKWVHNVITICFIKSIIVIKRGRKIVKKLFINKIKLEKFFISMDEDTEWQRNCKYFFNFYYFCFMTENYTKPDKKQINILTTSIIYYYFTQNNAKLKELLNLRLTLRS